MTSSVVDDVIQMTGIQMTDRQCIQEFTGIILIPISAYIGYQMEFGHTQLDDVIVTSSDMAGSLSPTSFEKKIQN